MSKAEHWRPGDLSILVDAAQARLTNLPATTLIRGQVYVPGMGMIPVMLRAAEAYEALSKVVALNEEYNEQKQHRIKMGHVKKILTSRARKKGYAR